MKKKNTLISLASVAALLCVGGGFALNANTAVSAEEEVTKHQTMMGASILITDGLAGDSNGIRFPVLVKDDVAEQITASKMYVLPADKWDGADAPTAAQLVANADTWAADTQWTDYYEANTEYDTSYQEAVVYMYNLPQAKYGTDFYVCSWIQLGEGETATEEYSEVINRSMSEVAKAAVESGAYDAEELGNYFTATYTVNKYLRTVYGNYEKTGEPVTVEGTAGEIPTVAGVEGYTLNETLTMQANEFANGATLNFYYENNDYTFESQELGNSDANLTLEKRVMKGVTAENMRGNTYYYSKSVNDGGTQNKFTYDNSVLGKYLMLNVYYLSTWSENKGVCFEAWSIGGGNGHVTSDILVKSYNDEGNIVQGSLIDYATAGNWITIALYMDPVALGADSTSCYFTFTHWTKNTLYFGEYTYLTADQFKALYEQPAPKPVELISGVVEYSGTNVQNNNNLVSINGVSSYADKSYVAITAKTNVAAPVMMYGSDGTTKLSAYQIFNEAGKEVTTVEANTTYTYVFYMDGAITVGDVVGKMFVDTAVDFTVEYGSAYTAVDNRAYNRFQYKVFEEKGVEGITYYSPNALSRQGMYKSGTWYSAADAVGTTSMQQDGTLKYTTTSTFGKNRHTFSIDNVTGFTKGTWIVVKVKGETEAPWACMWTYKGNNPNYLKENPTASHDCDYWTFRGGFAEDRSWIDEDPTSGATGLKSEWKGKWVYLAFKFECDVPVELNANYGGGDTITRGSFALGFYGTNSGSNDTLKGTMYVGGVYVMTNTAFYEFFAK